MKRSWLVVSSWRSNLAAGCCSTSKTPKYRVCHLPTSPCKLITGPVWWKAPSRGVNSVVVTVSPSPSPSQPHIFQRLYSGMVLVSRGEFHPRVLTFQRTVSPYVHLNQYGSVSDPNENSGSGAKENTDSIGIRMLKFLGWMGGFYSRKAVLTRSSQRLYESCFKDIRYEEFFQACAMPNTFQSWYLVAHLHIWLLLVRLKREGPDGTFMIKQVVTTFWEDVEVRMKELGVTSSFLISKNLREFLQQFYGFTLSYEEGLQSSDKVLASALWTHLFHEKENTDPVQVAKLVEYVRKQVQHMDGFDSKSLLEFGAVTLLPFTVRTPTKLDKEP